MIGKNYSSHLSAKLEAAVNRLCPSHNCPPQALSGLISVNTPMHYAYETLILLCVLPTHSSSLSAHSCIITLRSSK